MKRFFGMKPSCEIEIEKRYADENNYKITLQAGTHGWTVLYADGSSSYKDEDDTSENNFQKAYNCAVNDIGCLTELAEKKLRGERC